ncbi:MAG: Gfo/Idh/MocA family oxidoreductase [Candidatus Heimdallarchaeota archaeon]
MSNQTPRITIIGTGRMGYNHARLLGRLGFLDSVVDIDRQRAEAIGEQFKKPWYTSIEDLVKHRSPNGVIIAVPTRFHSEVARSVIEFLPDLQAMLIEKPISSSTEDALQLKKSLKQTHVKTIVGHIEVFNPVVTRIQEIVNQDIIGSMRSILFQRRGTITESRIEAVGDIYEDIGVHDFDVASRLIPKGKIRLFSVAIQSEGVDNSSTIILSHDSEELFVTFLLSREHAGKVRMIDIEGTKATLIANLLTQVIELRSLEIARGETESSAIRIPFSNGEQVKVYGEPLLLEIWNLIDCIRGISVPLVSLDDGINALKLVEAARQSTRTGQSVQLEI